MEKESVTASLEQLDYICNIVNSMRAELVLKKKKENEVYFNELEQEPVFCGYITTYKKQNGTTFKKRTKHKPYDYSCSKQYEEGQINSFGHEIISIIKDVQLNLKLNYIDMNKKWYVE